MRSLPGRALRDLRALMSSPAALVAVLLFAALRGRAVASFPPPVGAVAEARRPVARAAGARAPRSRPSSRSITSAAARAVPVANDGAKVVIVKFNDFMCPPCKQTYMEYKPVLAKWQATHPGLVKFILKDYPLDPECNTNTPGASISVRARRPWPCASRGSTDRAEEMEEWLFTTSRR